jgi:hypothetical protein
MTLVKIMFLNSITFNITRNKFEYFPVKIPTNFQSKPSRAATFSLHEHGVPHIMKVLRLMKVNSNFFSYFLR